MVSLPPVAAADATAFAFTPQLSPKTVSLPPSALIVSLPRRPQIVSPAAVPLTVLLPLSAPNGVGIDGSSGAGSVASGTPSPSRSLGPGGGGATTGQPSAVAAATSGHASTLSALPSPSRSEGGAGGSTVQLSVPDRRAFPPGAVLVSSSQKTGLKPPTHSACGLIAKPSLLRFAMPAGRSYALVAANFPAFTPDCATSNLCVRPSQLSSHAAHRWVLSGSYSRSITAGNPLSMVAMRVNVSGP